MFKTRIYSGLGFDDYFALILLRNIKQKYEYIDLYLRNVMKTILRESARDIVIPRHVVSNYKCYTTL